MFKKDAVKQACGGKRTQAPINLSQPYTSGDVLQIAAEVAAKKEEAAEAKKLKLEERARTKEQKEKEMKQKRDAAAAKREEVQKKNEDKEKQRKYTTCDICQKRRTAKTKNKNQWSSCENCKAYTLCPMHNEEFNVHLNECNDIQ